MNLKLSKTFYAWFAAVAVLAVLAFTAFSGLNAGKRRVQANLVEHNAQSLQQGLKYFYQDEDRYPSANEFQDKNLMLNYFNLYPPLDITSKNCEQSFLYKRLSSQNYQLLFCLPEGAAGFRSGWNEINGNF